MGVAYASSSSTKLTKMKGRAGTYGRPLFSSSGRSFLRSPLGLAFAASLLLSSCYAACPEACPSLRRSCVGGEFDISTSTYVLFYWF